MYDLIIRNGTVVDGSGKDRYSSDLGITDGRIVIIEDLTGARADTVIDATGLIVSPGFIDTHTHSDFTVWVDPRAESSIRQGVTTQVIGNCGHSCAPLSEENREALEKAVFGHVPGFAFEWKTFGEYLSALEAKGVAHNIAALVGHGTIRIAEMGFRLGPPTKNELDGMKNQVARSMSEGAFGLSTGLSYAPASSAEAGEIVELCKVVARYGGLYSTHIRSYESGFREATLEALKIGKEAGVPVHLSHHRPASKAGIDGRETLRILEEATERGLDVSCDHYPYTWGASTLTALLPAWALADGVQALPGVLRDSRKRGGILDHIRTISPSYDKYILMNGRENQKFVGKTLEEISRLIGKKPGETVLKLLEDEGEDAYSVYVSMHTTTEADLDEVITSDFYMLGSDGITLSTRGELASMRWHPRSYGAFPRMLSQYVRKKKLLTLEKAIMKMTSLPAKRFRLSDLGIIRVGMAGDVVVFDEQQVSDTSTYRNPNRYPRGILYVIVNGHVVASKNSLTEDRPGRVLRHGIRDGTTPRSITA